MDMFFNRFWGNNDNNLDPEIQQALKEYNEAYLKLMTLVNKRDEENKRKYRRKNNDFGFSLFDELFPSNGFTSFNGFENILKDMENINNWERRSWMSPDGSMSFSEFTRTYSSSDMEEGSNEESRDSKYLKMLNTELNLAVADQEFEKAARLRDEIAQIEDEKKQEGKK